MNSKWLSVSQTHLWFRNWGNIFLASPSLLDPLHRVQTFNYNIQMCVCVSVYLRAQVSAWRPLQLQALPKEMDKERVGCSCSICFLCNYSWWVVVWHPVGDWPGKEALQMRLLFGIHYWVPYWMAKWPVHWGNRSVKHRRRVWNFTSCLAPGSSMIQ